MLLTSVVIILGEVLEAALLISILLAMTRKRRGDPRWINLGLSLGLFLAFIYAIMVSSVSEWFDGVGQEVVNAAIQVAIYLLLIAIVVALTKGPSVSRRMNAIASLAVALAVAREGFEIVIYLFGFAHSPENTGRVLTGAALGLGVGFSIGALFYYALLALHYRFALTVSAVLLTLVGAGMCSQACMLLIQADWLPSQVPLWDTSDWLSEASLTGQLMYALMGYEATPSPLQVGVYFGSVAILGVAVTVPAYLKKHRLSGGESYSARTAMPLAGGDPSE